MIRQHILIQYNCIGHHKPEDIGPGRVGEGRRIVLGNMVEGRHGVHVKVGRLTLGQLDAGDAQRPDVHLPVILSLVHGQDNLTTKCAIKDNFIYER